LLLERSESAIHPHRSLAVKGAGCSPGQSSPKWQWWVAEGWDSASSADGADVCMGAAIPNAALFSLGLWVVPSCLQPFELGFIDFYFVPPQPTCRHRLRAMAFPDLLFQFDFNNIGVAVFIISCAPCLSSSTIISRLGFASCDDVGQRCRSSDDGGVSTPLCGLMRPQRTDRRLGRGSCRSCAFYDCHDDDLDPLKFGLDDFSLALLA
jgi:hypothetical protein